MIEAKHTPGPWRTAPGNIYGAIIADPTPEYIEKHADNIESYGGEVICESVLTNNRAVITASPEMHEALVCWQDARLESQFIYLSDETHKKWGKRFSEIYPGKKLETVRGLMQLAMALCDMAVLKAEGNQ